MTIRQAVILAAGNGSRLQNTKVDLPKPLQPVAGLSLIKRSILTAKRAGIVDFVIVTGYRGEELVQALSQDAELGVKLSFVSNEQWNQSNGVSLLKAAPFVENNFLLMMADHVFVPEAIQKILAAASGEAELLLGVDYDLAGIFDCDDATKVRLQGPNIVAIAKDLQDYQAYDTGLFVLSPKIFEHLSQLYERQGDVSLSEAVRALALGRSALGVDLTGYFWQDVDTPQALAHAETELFRRLVKPTDGWVSRNINRKISTRISRILIKAGLSPNQVTALTSLIGLLSGILVARGDYASMAWGAVLFNLTSILDGCDGEMARLKLSNSKLGEWLDTLSDNFTYLVFLIGLVLGNYRQSPSGGTLMLGILTLAGLAMGLAMMFFYLWRHTTSGSLLTVHKELEQQGGKARPFRFLFKLTFMVRRDFFALVFMILGIAGQFSAMLYLSCLALHLMWIFLLVQHRRRVRKEGLVLEAAGTSA